MLTTQSYTLPNSPIFTIAPRRGRTRAFRLVMLLIAIALLVLAWGGLQHLLSL
jgi:type VI protein secretion system component VasF